MVTLHEIKTLVQSYHPLVVIDTIEEERVIEHLASACQEIGAPLFTWSLARGLTKAPSKHAVLASTNSPLVALRHIEDLSVEGVFLLHDFAPHLADPAVARQFREVIQKFSRTPSCFVITGNRVRLPLEIDCDAIHYDMRLPDSEELSKVIDSALRSLTPHHDVKIDMNPAERATLLNALNGMTLNQARQSVASAMIEDGVLDAADISRVLDRKAKMIRDNGLLEYFPVLDNTYKLGGFDNLKDWLKRAAIGFTPEARVLELPAPRGILLVGVQGCGKSLAAKAIARQWNAPLLKLDAGSLYNKYLGETERNLRRAFKLAESLSPVVLWIDEIEKAFAADSSSSDSSDSGTSLRVLGSFLTWLQEKKDSVFVVGTANNLGILPPELLRKGRFDEIFFVDLPVADERSEIFEIHLRLKKQDPATFDLDRLVENTEGFSGAEIEQAVVAALYRALFLKRTLDTDFLISEILETIPLSVSRAEDIAALRARARGRFVNVRSDTRTDMDPLKILPTAGIMR